MNVCLHRPKIDPDAKSYHRVSKYVHCTVCMYIEGIPALLGIPPICHRARGTRSGHYTPHDQHMVKILKKVCVGGGAGFTLVMSSGCASVTFGVCTSMQKRSPCARREGHSKLVLCAALDRTETYLVSICPRHTRPAVCCCRSKPMTNKLHWLAGGVHCIIERPQNAFCTACIIKRINPLKKTRRLYTWWLQIPLSGS